MKESSIRDFLFLITALSFLVISSCLFAWHIWTIFNPASARVDHLMKHVIQWLYALMFVFWVVIWWRHLTKKHSENIKKKSSQEA